MPPTTEPEPPAVAVVAGHVCVDVIPSFDRNAGTTSLDAILKPGRLTQVGPILISTGGAVSNAGLALHRLGIPVKLMGKLGGDVFGRAAVELFDRIDPRLGAGMIIAAGEPGSYTIVINPPGVDRVFMHCPGPNDTFAAADISLDALAGAKVFHFGYPPIMRRMYLDGGAGLVAMLAGVRSIGVTVSLDMSQPDPNSEAGRVDWQQILDKALPLIDVFGANIEEITYMVDRPAFERLRAGDLPDGALLHAVGDTLIGRGAAVVMIKLGEHGLYVRTTTDRSRLEQMGALRPRRIDAWIGREVLSPCLRVDVAGTTGSGDCTHAGFLAAMIHDMTLEDAVMSAVAVGACSVESPDATSGVVPWDAVCARLAAGWPRLVQALDLAGWRTCGELWAAPGDTQCR